MNTENQPIESQAVVVREESRLERPMERLPLEEVHNQLLFIRQVMAQEMKEGQDYGKIPGCGDKPGLFQPGAQKLLLTFQLTPHVKKEVLRELPHPTIFGHREYEFTLTLRSKAGREWDGVGTCSTLESKYRYRKSSRKCPTCGKETIFKDKNPPHGFYCWAKKGGCGAKFGPSDPGIISQEEGKADNENPAEFWNTVRKMAFKRALVHGSINATNTSELWSQDLEDLPQAMSKQEDYGISNSQAMEAADDNPCFDTGTTEPVKPTPKPTTPPKTPTKPVSTPTKPIMDEKVLARYRLKALNNLQAAAGQPNRVLFTHFAMSRGWINGTQEPEQIPAEHVPTSPEAMAKLVEDLARFEGMARQDHADAVRENITK